MNRCWFLVVYLAIFSSVVSGHESRPSLLKLEEKGAGDWHAVFKQPQVNGRFLNLKVETNCTSGEITSVVGVSALQESFPLNCDEAPLGLVRIVGLDRTLVDTMVTVKTATGETSNYLISSGESTLSLNEPAPSVPAYLILGIEHLLFGIDHVLFVLVLLYIVSGWANLVKVVTSFTVAHSITLGLSAFDIITLSPPPVEALIALSIVMLARESLRSAEVDTTSSYILDKPWIVAFAFGLLHGLGFASALAEIGLPKVGAVLALFLFNVGIELGQLLIVAGSLTAIYILTDFACWRAVDS